MWHIYRTAMAFCSVLFDVRVVEMRKKNYERNRKSATSEIALGDKPGTNTHTHTEKPFAASMSKHTHSRGIRGIFLSIRERCHRSPGPVPVQRYTRFCRCASGQIVFSRCMSPVERPQRHVKNQTNKMRMTQKRMRKKEKTPTPVPVSNGSSRIRGSIEESVDNCVVRDERRACVCVIDTKRGKNAHRPTADTWKLLLEIIY